MKQKCETITILQLYKLFSNMHIFQLKYMPLAVELEVLVNDFEAVKVVAFGEVVIVALISETNHKRK